MDMILGKCIFQNKSLISVNYDVGNSNVHLQHMSIQ